MELDLDTAMTGAACTSCSPSRRRAHRRRSRSSRATTGSRTASCDRRSNQLARGLRDLGVETGTLVGICLDRSADLLVAMLGVLKAGAAYVPIEPTYPPERQEFMLADAQAPVLLTQERFLGVIDPRGCARPVPRPRPGAARRAGR